MADPSQLTLETCSIAKGMEEANRHGQTVMSTKVSGNTTKNMVEENKHGQMAMCTMGSGKTEKNMEEASIHR